MTEAQNILSIPAENIDMSELAAPPRRLLTEHEYVEFLSQKAGETDIQIITRDNQVVLILGTDEFRAPTLRDALMDAMRK